MADAAVRKPVRRRAAPHDANHRRKAPRTLSTTKLFCSAEGAPLSADAVGLIVRRLRERLAANRVKLHLHPHLFRHIFLTEKALDGENPSMVRRWAGHRKYEMTDYYFGLAEAKLAAIKPKQSTLAGLAILPKKVGRPRRRGAEQEAAADSS